MLTIAGGIILALVGIVILLLVVSAIAHLFTPKRKYDPRRFPLGNVPARNFRQDRS